MRHRAGLVCASALLWPKRHSTSLGQTCSALFRDLAEIALLLHSASLLWRVEFSLSLLNILGEFGSWETGHGEI